MKKKSIFLLFLTFSISTFSQSLVVTGNTFVTGNPNLQLSSHLTVTNIANKSLDVRCKINPIINVSGTEFSFCWGASCYGAGTLISGMTATMASNQTLIFPDTDAHTGYYDAFGLSSIGEVEYCFYDDANPTDETCFTVTFNATTTAVNNKVEIKNILEFFPNPAEEYINIEYKIEENSKLAIVNILGDKIKEIDLSSSGFQRINVTDLPNGIYFGRLLVAEKFIKMKKIIIKR
jgi:hypothetical protein